MLVVYVWIVPDTTTITASEVFYFDRDSKRIKIRAVACACLNFQDGELFLEFLKKFSILNDLSTRYVMMYLNVPNTVYLFFYTFTQEVNYPNSTKQKDQKGEGSPSKKGGVRRTEPRFNDTGTTRYKCVDYFSIFNNI